LAPARHSAAATAAEGRYHDDSIRVFDAQSSMSIIESW